MNTYCPFCPVEQGQIFFQDENVVCAWDAYPVTPGHALIIPRRHVTSFAGLHFMEAQAITARVLICIDKIATARFDERWSLPNGYNVGWNDGTAAGQTVPHFHVHVIPRRNGDVEDPRGGVRNVIPGKGSY